jgi:hypothetical protein
MAAFGRRHLGAVALLVATAACSGQSGDVSGTEPAAGIARIALSAAPIDVVRVVATIAAPDMSPITTDLWNDGGGGWSTVIPAIPAGPDRTATLEAFDASGLLAYTGSASGIVIIGGQLNSVTIFLQPVNPPPTFYNTVPFISAIVVSANPVETGMAINLRVDAYDPDPGDALTFQWTASDGQLSSPLSASTAWTAPGYEGPQFFTVVVWDSSGAAADFSFPLNVIGPPAYGDLLINARLAQWPIVSDVSAYPTRIPPVPGATVSLSSFAWNPDGDPLFPQWSSTCAGSFSDPWAPATTFMLAGVPVDGRCEFVVAVTEPSGAVAFGTVVVPVAPPPPVVIGGGISPAVPVSGSLSCTTASSNTGRKAAVDAAGTVYVGMLCQGQAFVATSSDGGQAYTPALPLPFTNVGELALQGAGPGVAHAVAIENGLLVLSTTFDGGRSWSAPAMLGDGVGAWQVSVAVLGDAVIVQAPGPIGMRVYRVVPGGPTGWTDLAIPVAFGDVLADARTGSVWIVTDTPDLHLAVSRNGGATFEPEIMPPPPGIAYYSDWAIGGGQIFVIGSAGGDVLFRIPTDAPTTSTPVAGFIDSPGMSTRAVAANEAGDAYVVSQSMGGVALQRLASGAAMADPPRMLATEGTFPGVAAGPGSSAVVVYTVGQTVYASVQSF